MSYEIVRKVFVDKETNTIKLEYKSNNVFPATWYVSEYCKEDVPLETKIRYLFEGAYQGWLKFQSSCGKFYKIFKEMDEWTNLYYSAKKAARLDIDLDHMYHTNTYSKRCDYFTYLAMCRYFNRSIPDVATWCEKEVEEELSLYLEKQAEYKREDKIPIFTACNSDIYKGYIVVIDNNNNLYLCKKEQYPHPGTLEKASEAILIKEAKHNDLLYYILTGCMKTVTFEEAVNRGRSPIERAARAVCLEEAKKTLLNINLLMSVKPWLDFDEVEEKSAS